ncbi:MAG TPA: pyridoxamine 5'-phosphate oxidase family protein [Dehalococcoidia bacterium]|nr:pyridoxamine 5'-phosphate oxidase family protein [Dehalococcoidia bacterium]
MDEATAARVRAILGDRPTVHLGTVKVNGAPHVTPVWVAFDGHTFYVSVSGKQKLRNLERNQRVALSAHADGPTLPHLIVEGEATLRYDDEAVEIRRRLIESYTGPEGLAKYLVPPLLAPGHRALVEIAPTKVIVKG